MWLVRILCRNTTSDHGAPYAMAIFSWTQKLIFGSSEHTFASGALERIKLERVKSMKFGAQQTVQKREILLDSEKYNFTLFH